MPPATTDQLRSQSLAIEVIEHVEQPEAEANAELVVHDQTWLIEAGTNSGSSRSHTIRFLGLIRRFKSKLSVDAIHPLVVPAKALDAARVQGAQAETPVAVSCD